MTDKTPLFYARASCDTMMRKFSPEDLPPKGHFHYHQGVFLSGMQKVWELSREEKYYEYAKAWVDSCIDKHGNILDYNEGQLDDLQPGILLFPIYERTNEEKYRVVLDRLAKRITEFPTTEEGGFWHKEWYPEQMWLDGLYMAGPLCAEYAKKFNSPKFWDICLFQAVMMREKTMDKTTGLWYHAWDAKKVENWADKETGRSPEFWGRSIGWVPVALLDELSMMPKDFKGYDELVSIVCDLLKSVCNYQSNDGRWYQVVDKGNRKENWLENSCSCLYVAAICKAVRMGFLDASYLEIAKKGYEGVIRSLTWNDNNLIVGNVCIGTGVGDFKHYCDRPVSENDLHGVGAFLIMCTEYAQVL